MIVEVETAHALPVAMQCSSDLLGRRYPSSIDGQSVTVCLPRLNDQSRGVEQSEELIHPQFRHVPDDADWAMQLNPSGGHYETWGTIHRHAGEEQLSLRSIGLVYDANDADDVESTADHIEQSREHWWASTESWIEIFTAQVMIASDVLVLGGRRYVWTEVDGARRRVGLPGGRVTIGAPRRIMLVNDAVLTRALTLSGAGTSPPLAWDLIRQSHRAIYQREHRRAVAEAGTAAEVALTRLIRRRIHNLDARVAEALLKKYQTLSNRYDLLRKLDPSVGPIEGFHDDLVQRRNAVIHEAADVSGTHAQAALAVAERIVLRAYPLSIGRFAHE